MNFLIDLFNWFVNQEPYMMVLQGMCVADILIDIDIMFNLLTPRSLTAMHAWVGGQVQRLVAPHFLIRVYSFVKLTNLNRSQNKTVNEKTYNSCKTFK